jgi:hypothetical protein
MSKLDGLNENTKIKITGLIHAKMVIETTSEIP